jgi:hypothetical protein
MIGFSHSFLIPPTVFIVLCLLAALLPIWYPRQGARLGVACTAILYLSALPVFAQGLSRLLVMDPPTDAALRDAQATDFQAGQAFFQVSRRCSKRSSTCMSSLAWLITGYGIDAVDKTTSSQCGG